MHTCLIRFYLSRKQFRLSTKKSLDVGKTIYKIQTIGFFKILVSLKFDLL